MESNFARCSDEQFWIDRERVKLLIDLYEERPCLWITKITEYKVQSKKKAAKNDIGKHFGMTGEETWKKLQYMRDYRRRNLKKVKDSHKSGAGTDDIFVPAVWWYDHLTFLDFDFDGRETSDNLDTESTFNVEESGLDEQESFTSCEEQMHSTPSVLKKKSSKRKTDDDLVSIAKKCLSDIKNLSNEGGHENKGPTDLDEYERYGLHVAAEMKRIPDELTKQLIKTEIQQLFLKAHTGQLRQRNTQFESPNEMQIHSRYGPSMTSVVPPNQQWQQWQTNAPNYPMSTNNQSCAVNMFRPPYRPGASHATYETPAFTQRYEYQQGQQHLFHPVNPVRQYDNWNQQSSPTESIQPRETGRGSSLAESVGESMCITNE